MQPWRKVVYRDKSKGKGGDPGAPTVEIQVTRPNLTGKLANHLFKKRFGGQKP